MLYPNIGLVYQWIPEENPSIHEAEWMLLKIIFHKSEIEDDKITSYEKLWDSSEIQLKILSQLKLN